MAPALKIRLALAKLERDGKLTPKGVVAAARDPAHPLHSYFEWDDAQAAAAYREDQARQLIRSVNIQITVEERVITSVGYVHDPDLPAGEAGYVNISRIRQKSERARDVLVDELGRARAAVERARMVADVLGFNDQLESLLETIASVASRVPSGMPPQGGNEAFRQ